MASTKHQYGIYLAPRQQLPIFVNSNPTWGGIHITLAGFSDTHSNIKYNLKKISNLGSKDWQINKKKVSIHQDKIVIESKTLDKLSQILHKKEFKRVKGPLFSKCKWHISIVNNDPGSILPLLENQNWDICIVRKNDSNFEWLERYPLKLI